MLEEELLTARQNHIVIEVAHDVGEPLLRWLYSDDVAVHALGDDLKCEAHLVQELGNTCVGLIEADVTNYSLEPISLLKEPERAVCHTLVLMDNNYRLHHLLLLQSLVLIVPLGVHGSGGVQRYRHGVSSLSILYT